MMPETKCTDKYIYRARNEKQHETQGVAVIFVHLVKGCKFLTAVSLPR